MATRLKRLAPPPRTLRFGGLLASALAASVALAIPIGIVQTLAASVLFVIFLWLWWCERAGRNAVAVAVGLAAAGLLVGALPFDPTRAFADGLITCAIVVVVVTLIGDRVAVRGFEPSARWSLGRAELELRERIARVDEATWRRLPVIAAVVLGVLALGLGSLSARGGDGWKLAGSSDGATVWNAAFLAAPLHRDGAHLVDDAIVAGAGAAPRVGVADSPLLTALKLAVPAAWRGPEAINLLDVLDLAAVVFCAVWLVATLAGSTGAAAVAVLAALVCAPVLQQTAVAAPFDLWPALLLATLALVRPGPLLLVGAAACGFLNVSGGYELAVLAAGLAAAGRLPAARALRLGVLGVASSLAGAALSRLLAPDATTFALWWTSNEAARVARATGVSWPWALVGLGALALLAGWVLAVRARAPIAGQAGLATLVAAVFAVPGLLGGVPLLVPARLLDTIPLGWPSLRILAVGLVLLAVPLAGSLRPFFEREASLRAPLRALAVVALALCTFAMLTPRRPPATLAATPSGAVIAELPIAEAGSRASVTFADELLERDAFIVQPIPYVSARPPLDAGRSAEDVIRTLGGLHGERFVVVRHDVYADPAQRYAQPTVIEAADFAVPDLARDSRLTLATLTENAEIYRLR